MRDGTGMMHRLVARCSREWRLCPAQPCTQIYMYTALWLALLHSINFLTWCQTLMYFILLLVCSIACLTVLRCF